MTLAAPAAGRMAAVAAAVASEAPASIVADTTAAARIPEIDRGSLTTHAS
jgi:hypothetical protein